MTGVHGQADANGIEAVRLFYIPVNLTVPQIRYHRLGISLSRKQLTVDRLHQALADGLNREIYTNTVRRFAQELANKPGLTLAVTAIEKLITTGKR
jgi:UDP:flavonoid glycosyltransferase YjiC (YdhE family)